MVNEMGIYNLRRRTEASYAHLSGVGRIMAVLLCCDDYACLRHE
jgi:hypothetical protein